MSASLLKNATHICHRSQNEMIEVVGKHIILQNLIKAANFHTLICDEVISSTCNDEVLSLCTVYALLTPKKQIREEFIELIDVDRITGEVLFDTIDKFYKRTNVTMGHQICRE